MKRLIELKKTYDKAKHPNFPDYARVEPKYTDKTANGLTKAVCDFLNLSGHQAERISTTGRYIDESKVVTDVLGRKRKIGTGKYIPGNGTKGSADISSTIKMNINGRLIGVSVKWEVKIGKDRQSEYQKDYQLSIEEATGYYFIVRNFEEFLNHYDTLTL
jgi:hypothetical protein